MFPGGAGGAFWEHFPAFELEPGVLGTSQKMKPELLGIDLELGNSDSKEGSNPDFRTRTSPTRQVHLEPELCFGFRRTLELGFEFQA